MDERELETEPFADGEPRFAEYPRIPQTGLDRDPKRLQSLAKAYFGLSYMFAVNLPLWLMLAFVIDPMADRPDFVLGGYVAVFTIAPVFTVSQLVTQPLAHGLNKSRTWYLTVSAALVLNAFVCGGIIGYAVLQTVASSAMRTRFGIEGGLFGIRPKAVRQKVAELLEASVS